MDINGSQADASSPSGRTWHFAGRTLDESRLELCVNGRPVELELKPLEILVQLLQHAGEVVTKEQLLDAVWPGLAVVEGSLTTAIYKLRKALDDPESKIIVTVPRVGYRMAVPVQSEPRPISVLAVERKQTTTDARRRWVVAAGIAIVALVAALYSSRKSSALPAPAKTVAILPFQNAGADHSIDYLSVALPDEVATTLSYTRGLSVRPFASTSKYRGSQVDPVKAGRELGVKSVVTGHFLEGGEQLHVTLEAVDVDSARILWRDTLDVPAQNLTAMQRQIAITSREGLAPRLGSSEFATETAATAENAEAYQLYLRSISVANDRIPNQEAIAMLERVVALEPGYAPAWNALALRYYYKSRYSNGGDAALQNGEAAAERAKTLDPNYVSARALLVEIQVEQGEIAKAYQEAAALVRQRPDSAAAHFALSYVLRYAGLLKEAAGQCEVARSLDPHNVGWRSCVAVFEQLGDYERALEFIALDNPKSEWARTHLIQNYVRQGNVQAAAQIAPADIPAWDSFTMIQACAERRSAADIDKLASHIEPSGDPELNYASAAHLAYCGKVAAAIPLLRRSITAGHCSYPAIDQDPLLANMRNMPEFTELRNSAIACQEEFLQQKRQIDTAMR